MVDWKWELGEVEKRRRGEIGFDSGALVVDVNDGLVVEPSVRQREWRLEADRKVRDAIVL